MKRIFIILLLIVQMNVHAQSLGDTSLWHGKERVLRYEPDGSDFVITNGTKRFTRALYGTNTGFRVEAGDLPEFALYMPGMGGNFKFGIIAGNKSKWLIEATHIKATYRPGSMLYEIKDPILGNGALHITILALADAEGMIIQTDFKNVNNNAELIWAFGGASGKRFSRDGDIGADPESSFYLQPENCKDNAYKIDKNSFLLIYGSGRVLTEEERYEIQNFPASNKQDSADRRNMKKMGGLFPSISELKLVDAAKQQSPIEFFSSGASSTPAIAGKMKITNTVSYFLIQNAAAAVTKDYNVLRKYFDDAEAARKKLAERVKVNTPDKYINTIGGALSIAADAIWEDPSYLHGAIAWRMRLNAWRGAYVADPLGWHDRARKHFSSYALSQVTTPPVTGVVMDTALHLARHQEKIGTALFSDGYICRNPNGDIRAHHYDMNLVFVDQLLNHFNWTGDIDYVKQMWPLIKRHLAWEKRNFDADGDGLYDAYAAIWASDALQYSGGGATHSSAYNYRSNKVAAELAKLIGEDGTPFKQEADKILAAIQKNLWLPQKGWYAEYKDLLGKQLVHPHAGIWTIYHTVDSKVPDPFQAYQALRYIDTEIPRIPVKAKGFEEKGLYLLSTSNWQPYTWSINNVALGENLHTALAYWQGNRSEEAYRLWRSTLFESMYMSSSAGGFQQLSFYDAIRGELYRDFADGLGVTGRTLVEGLFGIQPNALYDTLTIQPGFPAEWDHASLQVPDIHFDFKRTANTDNYTISQFFKKNLKLKFLINARMDDVKSITVNGEAAKWSIISSSVGKPLLQINVSAAKEYKITINWKGKTILHFGYQADVDAGNELMIHSETLKLKELYDPQNVINRFNLKENGLTALCSINPGNSTFFIKVQQGIFSWWEPVCLKINPYNPYRDLPIKIPKNDYGTNYEKVDINKYFNDKLTNIFKEQYFSPRPKSPTLQLPIQGIGNWCYPLTTANINDKGMRQAAGSKNEIKSLKGIPFTTPSDTLLNNIVFTSQWDNYPDSIVIPLSGKASGVFLLMAGSTNPMQSRITNGIVYINYTDGRKDSLHLKNPENWWPIEQDYYTDGFAFTTNAPRPERLYLKEGKFANEFSNYITIRGFSNRGIDGGAATLLDIPLNVTRTLQSITVQAVANDVVIGLMAVTLVR